MHQNAKFLKQSNAESIDDIAQFLNSRYETDQKTNVIVDNFSQKVDLSAKAKKHAMAKQKYEISAVIDTGLKT